jgi:hypothetical protein
MVSRQMQKLQSSAAASGVSGSLVIIEGRTMFVSLPVFFWVFSSLRFYAQLITSLLKPMEEHTEDARHEEDLSRLPVSPAPMISDSPNQGPSG